MSASSACVRETHNPRRHLLADNVKLLGRLYDAYRRRTRILSEMAVCSSDQELAMLNASLRGVIRLELSLIGRLRRAWSSHENAKEAGHGCATGDRPELHLRDNHPPLEG